MKLLNKKFGFPKKIQVPPEIKLFVWVGFIFAIFFSLAIYYIPIKILMLVYLVTLLGLYRLSNLARIVFIGFAILFMIPFIVVLLGIIWTIATGHATERYGEAIGWGLAFSIVLFPLFMYKLFAIIYLNKPDMKKKFWKKNSVNGA